ncbi:hypothetical protein EVAR_61649_1 [Eumeta japonica]|uniref:Uncharacterized protein n=1 Tax=Eumeta variegata TaxID=151549 RepID=A0A4C1Z9E3_EUMVA|nr:hypothetical protein EVAR_61649_1 [Eumeta japonica]
MRRRATSLAGPDQLRAGGVRPAPEVGQAHGSFNFTGRPLSSDTMLTSYELECCRSIKLSGACAASHTISIGYMTSADLVNYHARAHTVPRLSDSYIGRCSELPCARTRKKKRNDSARSGRNPKRNPSVTHLRDA